MQQVLVCSLVLLGGLIHGACAAACIEGDNFNGRCFFINKTRTNWQGASDSCRQRGMELASIRTQEENDWLFALVKRSAETREVWLGGRQNATDEPWYWADGTTFNFTMWADGRPDTMLGERLCMAFASYPNAQNGTWDNEHCIMKKKVCICAGPAALETKTPETTESGCTASKSTGSEEPRVTKSPRFCYIINTEDGYKMMCK